MKMTIYTHGQQGATLAVDCLPHACAVFEQCALHSRVRAVVRNGAGAIVAIVYIDGAYGVCVREPQDPSYRHWDL